MNERPTLKEAARRALIAMSGSLIFRDKYAQDSWMRIITDLQLAVSQPDTEPVAEVIENYVTSRERVEEVAAELYENVDLQVGTKLYPHLSPLNPPDPLVWECKAGGLRPLSQKHYDMQLPKVQAHYTRIVTEVKQPLTKYEIDNICKEQWCDGEGTMRMLCKAIERECAKKWNVKLGDKS